MVQWVTRKEAHMLINRFPCKLVGLLAHLAMVASRMRLIAYPHCECLPIATEQESRVPSSAQGVGLGAGKQINSFSCLWVCSYCCHRLSESSGG